MHYLIYIVKPTGGAFDALKRVGLDDIAQGAEMFELSDGANRLSFTDKLGKFVTWNSMDRPEANPPTNPDDQKDWTWIGAKKDGDLEADRFFIGYDPDNRPVPLDLQRSKLLMKGHDVKLADGHLWRIPSYTQLDATYEMGDDGSVMRVPIDKYKEFVRGCEQYKHELFSAVGLGHIPFPYSEAPDPTSLDSENVKYVSIEGGLMQASRALGIHYRLNLEIALALGLFTDEVLPGVIAATCDIPEIAHTLGEKKSTEVSVSIPVMNCT